MMAEPTEGVLAIEAPWTGGWDDEPYPNHEVVRPIILAVSEVECQRRIDAAVDKERARYLAIVQSLDTIHDPVVGDVVIGGFPRGRLVARIEAGEA